jgi:hypothetical protein
VIPAAVAAMEAAPEGDKMLRPKTCATCARRAMIWSAGCMT